MPERRAWSHSSCGAISASWASHQPRNASTSALRSGPAKGPSASERCSSATLASARMRNPSGRGGPISVSSALIWMTWAPGASFAGAPPSIIRVPSTTTTSACGSSARAASQVSAIGWCDGRALVPFSVISTGACSDSARRASWAEARDASTPPPAIITGNRAPFSRPAATSISFCPGRSAPGTSGPTRCTSPDFCNTSCGISTATGCGRPPCSCPKAWLRMPATSPGFFAMRCHLVSNGSISLCPRISCSIPRPLPIWFEGICAARNSKRELQA